MHRRKQATQVRKKKRRLPKWLRGMKRNPMIDKPTKLWKLR